MAQVGRPRALDDSKRREVCALVSAGMDLTGAAHYVGCAPSTIRREALRNEDFFERLRNAQLMAELEPLRALREKARTNWRAAAWYLERVSPRRFAKKPLSFQDPEDFEAQAEIILDLISQEIPDEQTALRIYRRINAVMSQSAAELRASEKPLRNPSRRKST